MLLRLLKTIFHSVSCNKSCSKTNYSYVYILFSLPFYIFSLFVKIPFFVRIYWSEYEFYIIIVQKSKIRLKKIRKLKPEPHRWPIAISVRPLPCVVCRVLIVENFKTFKNFITTWQILFEFNMMHLSGKRDMLI